MLYVISNCALLTRPTVFEISTPFQLQNVQSDWEWCACMASKTFGLAQHNPYTLLIENGSFYTEIGRAHV